MRLFIRRSQSPRVILLATNKHILSFRKVGGKSADGGAKANVVVELRPRAEVDLSRYEPIIECFGCVGLTSVGKDVFLCVITERSRASMPTPRRTIWNVHAVEFFSLTREYYDTEEQEHPCASLRKFFALGGFLYSSDFDLTARIVGGENKPEGFSGPVDACFMWNRFMSQGLIQFSERSSNEDKEAIEESEFLTTLIRGFASSVPVNSEGVNGILTVVSRQSWMRAGTRYNSRGIDDDGHVANFVESETVLWLRNGVQFGFIQLRGSVPLFWEQDPQLLSAKISLTRPIEATEPALRKHFDQLIERFGSVHVVDLLASTMGSRGSSQGQLPSTRGNSHSSSGYATSMSRTSSFSSGGSGSSSFDSVGSGVGPATEADVSLRYQTLVDRIPNMRYVHFDFHKEVAGLGYSAASKLIDRIQDSMLEFGFYSYNPTTKSTETEQIGVFRVNCLDCLDRTNLVQQLISKDALDLFLDYHELYASEDLWNAHATLWADNGDQLSHNYTGTGALKSSYTRSGRMNIAGALSDVSKSVSRLYINNFVDKTRQSAIEEILGRAEGQVPVVIFDPINDHVREEMKNRIREYLSESQISIFAATFNLNGKTLDNSRDDISAWLFPPAATEGGSYPDLYIIGFQEMVELTTSQILNVDPSRKMYWEDVVGNCLNSRSEHYVLLRSGQLVGTAVMFFVKRSKMNSVTEVEGTSKKTALGGITGNKGGVAVGFKYANTRFMFINSHLAAGINNVEDRHNDYKLLSNGLRLSGNRRMKDVDVVIWVGDLNFRVDLPNETVRKMMDQKSKAEFIQRLQQHDQLIRQMERGETFPYFNEQKINFMPTYKFDAGTTHYDTSEKQRTPSWTDRILLKGQRVKQRSYDSVPQITFSDHRPVYAIYDVTVAVVDTARADKLYSQLYDRRREHLMANDDQMVAFDPANEMDDTSSETSSSRDLHLQHPSSDTQKWWAGGGLSTNIHIQPPGKDMVLNPEKVNPFGSQKPDFVKKPRTASPQDQPTTSSRLSPARTPSPSASMQLSPRRSNASMRSQPVPPVPRSVSKPDVSTASLKSTRKPVPPPPTTKYGYSTPNLMDAALPPTSTGTSLNSTTSNAKKAGSSNSSIKSEIGSLMDSDSGKDISFKSLI